MARSRNIKPSFFINDVLTTLTPLDRLLFIGLWCLADRDGFLENRPRKIKWQILPHDDCDVENMLKNLQKNGFIIFFEFEKVEYIQILNFKKHQKPHKNETSIFISDNRIGKKSEPLGKKTEVLGKKPLSLGRNEERGMRNEERGMRNEECGMRIEESRDCEKKQNTHLEKECSIFEHKEEDVREELKHIPQNFSPTKEHRQIADGYGLDLDQQAELFKAHYKSSGKLMIDWKSKFSMWLHRAKNYQRNTGVKSNGEYSNKRRSGAEVFWENTTKRFKEAAAEEFEG